MIFYIDTSSNYLYTGIYKDSQTIVERKLNLNHDLSTFAIDEIKKMFDEKNIDKKDIKKIIVVSGPGSFTGIRIGMTIAKIYAYCFNIPITQITSLEAMNISNDTDTIHVPLIDARRGFCYAGVFLNNKELIPSQYIEFNKLMDIVKEKEKELGKEITFITNDNYENKTEYDPNILKIVETYKDKENINAHLISPTYFKLTEAEEEKNKLN